MKEDDLLDNKGEVSEAHAHAHDVHAQKHAYTHTHTISLNQTSSLSQVVQAIFGFCDMRNFTDCTEVLLISTTMVKPQKHLLFFIRNATSHT